MKCKSIRCPAKGRGSESPNGSGGAELVAGVSSTIDVSTSADVGEARRQARALAESIGFSASVCEELAIVVSELGTNILKHAGKGSMTARVLQGERSGIEIEALDSGPGVADVDRAFEDGYSTVGSLGFGLGAVHRLSDEVLLTSPGQAGTRVVVRKLLKPQSTPATSHRLDVGAATRPHPRMQGVNGDAFVISRNNSSLLVGVIDGLGHGQFAQRASQTARRYIETHSESALDEIFRGAGRACRPTRGAAMALARIDFGLRTLAVASVGNVEMRLRGGYQPLKYLVRRGIVGLNAPNAPVSGQPWADDSVLLVFSDGIRTHWDADEVPGIGEGASATVVAGRILRKYARDEDDATVLVVKGALN